ncbi:S-adenosyl-L-methionine-dependent methyltransferase [Pavlovales sp. CCMP2436]|nr:S-adenosyl-L-methionine-dependent methyltransferase [Pavlovales sp. CCMP2436]
MSVSFAWFVALAASASMQVAPSAQQQAFDVPHAPSGAELPSAKICAAVDALGVTADDLEPWADASEMQPEKLQADFVTWLRDLMHTAKRSRLAAAGTLPQAAMHGVTEGPGALLDQLFSSEVAHGRLLAELDGSLTVSGHHADSKWWVQLHATVRHWAAFQAETRASAEAAEAAMATNSFAAYASTYDCLIGQPCLEQFMSAFLSHFFEAHVPDPSSVKLLSIGCGTGLVEKHIMQAHGVKNLRAFDFSAEQVAVAQKRGVRAEVGDVLQMGPERYGMQDVCFAGLNVFHYLPAHQMGEAIQRTASVLKPGGWFVGDFITPDHNRWYPNVKFGGEDRRVVSLRTLTLLEKEGRMHQQSSIVTIDLRSGRARLNDAGTHCRHLPAMLRVRLLFEEAFGPDVQLFDAISMEPLHRDADTCPSTRYVVFARKAAK